MERQRQFDEQMMGGNMHMSGGPNGMGAPEAQMQPPNLNGNFPLPAAILAQYPALQGLQWDQLAAGGPDDMDDTISVSGRSSFDASSGAESYFEDDDGGYVSGPGTGFGTGQGFAHGGHDWPSDYEGR